MNSKFLTPVILGSALAVGALNFVACGEDNGTVAVPTGNSSASNFVPVSRAAETETTAIKFDDMGISGSTLNSVKFKGSITLDLSDSSTVADVNAVRFTDMNFDIESVNKTSGGVATMMVPPDFNGQVITTVNLAEIGLATDLNENYTECGDFRLIITASATDGQIPSVSKDTILFVRPEAKCKAPESSSSEAKVPGAPLKAVSIKVSTKTHKCLTFATGAATADPTGDVCFKTFGTQGNVQLSSTNGFKFAVYDNINDGDRTTNYSKNWLPENPTTDSFTYLEPALKEVFPDFLNEVDVFFVAIGPNYVRNSGSAAGFYAFVVSEQSTPDTNGDVSFTLLVYEAM